MVVPVYLFDVCVGHLKDTDNTLIFTYTPEWLAHPKACSISHSLPLREKPYKGKECLAYFSGLLPEETIHNHFCSELDQEPKDILSLLSRFGFDCKGAVRFKEIYSPSKSSILSPQELEDLVRYIPIDPHLIKTHTIAAMLPGKQAKATITAHDQFFCKPTSHFISSHIIKTDFSPHKQRILNEVFCMTLAKKLRLNVSKLSYMPFKDLDAFITERFDRLKVDQETIPIHCEDFCQMLGYPPEQKFECDGGPRLKEYLDLIRHRSDLAILDLKLFLDAIIFNTLIGNHAAHGKNFSFVYHPNGVRLSPLHDLMCTEIYQVSPMAISMNKKFHFEDLSSKDFGIVAEEIGIGKNYLKNRFLTFAKILLPAADTILNKNKLLQESAVIKKIYNILSERTKRISQLL
jgi:serine/threonine-protein kinase HipA